MNYKENILKIITECCRVLVGGVFIFSGITKAIDPTGGAIKIEEYLNAFGLEMLSPLSMLASLNLSAIEFTLGVCLLLGAYRKYASLLSLILMGFMTPLTLYLAVFDPVSDCGCFGDALVVTNWETFFKNVVLLAAIIFAFLNNRRMTALYSFKVIWFIPLYAYIFSLAFSYYNYSHLPIIDFRPYKVGENIPSLMTIPEGAEEDEYRYSFIYEKEGVQKEFSLEELPDDPAWEFVDSNTELIKKGYEPPVSAFNLYNLFGDDVTDILFENSDGVFLLIAHKLEKASEERIDEINNLYDYAVDNGLLFYGVTASSFDEINRWTDYTGAEYPFLMADDVLLKTIVRSNPGLVLLRGGTILGKWNYRDIPGEENLTEVMESALKGDRINQKEDALIMFFILTFAVPLLLVWVYDWFRTRRKEKTVQSKPTEA
ncbi:DoxX family protein [Parabacteroides sp. OttesenSCG-928-G07]|nr:DoxX family protein [Parabacteroides sp. OttesenSCG-928-G07]